MVVIADVHVPLTDETMLHAIYVRGTNAEARKYAATFQPTHCIHEHDCCGRWYQHSPAKVHHAETYYDTVWVIKRVLTQNV